MGGITISNNEIMVSFIQELSKDRSEVESQENINDLIKQSGLTRLVTSGGKLVLGNNYKTSRLRFVSFIPQTEKNVQIILKILALIL